MAIGKEFFELEEKIRYNFKDITLLQTALTHSSYANEMKGQGHSFESNERLEFLGDAVLQMVVSDYLFSNYQKRAEGIMTKMRQHLVCEKTLAKIASKINLGDYINVGKGEERTDCRRRPKVLADVLEALFAAIYLDAGQKEVYSGVIISLISDEIDEAVVMQNGDYKTLLQQIVEKDGSAILEYEIVKEEGPEHDKMFTVVARINNNVVGQGTSKSKKDAEMQAARVALGLFGVLE